LKDAPPPAVCALVCTMWDKSRGCIADTAAMLCRHRPVGVCAHGAETAQRWAKEKERGNS